MTTTYFLNSIMGNVFKTKTTPALPSKIYLGLSSTRPTVGGTGATEPNSSAGYARVPLDNLSAPNNGVISNTVDVSFPESTETWGIMSYFVIYDAATGGNLLMYESLSQTRSVEAATVVTVKTGSLKMTLANPA